MTTTTATANGNGNGGSGNPTAAGWRLPGQHHRSYLLSTDEETGGSDFTLNATVPITKYYQVSRRAYHQFRDSVAHMNDNNGEYSRSSTRFFFQFDLIFGLILVVRIGGRGVFLRLI